MRLDEIQAKVASSEYDFLRDGSIKHDLVLLTVAGSHAYGLETETSDLDLRGIAMQNPDEIFGLREFESYANEATDTTIYGFNKAIRLLRASNINMLELLGCNPEHYLILTDVGREIIDNKALFLSQDIARSIRGQVKQIKHKYFAANSVGIPIEKRFKAAAQAVRVLEMGAEILRDGSIQTYREGASHDSLQGIKHGDYTLIQAFDCIASVEVSFELALQTSDLPQHVDDKRVNEFVMDINRRCVK